MASAPASAEAERWAPGAHARAAQLSQDADAAVRRGDSETAALLAEQAIAAHEHAWALARLARAERRRLSAEAELGEQRSQLDALRAERERLGAEAGGLELRAAAARGALPATALDGSAERQQSRRRAAAALATQARLLCVSAGLLGEEERVKSLVTRLDQLEQELAKRPSADPISAAGELRAECLAVISEVRRRNTAPAAATPPAVSPERGRAPLPADAVLDELSAAGLSPSRDERGVSVSLRGVLGADGALTSTARQELRQLAHVAGQHREFPLLLVGHSGGSGAPAVERELAAVRAELGAAGAPAAAAQSAGADLPLVLPSSPGARARNARVELVFVAPGL